MLGELQKLLRQKKNNEAVTSVTQHVHRSECNQCNQGNFNIHLRDTLSLTFVFPLPHRKGIDLLCLPHVYGTPCKYHGIFFIRHARQI